ncbi:DNA polymerase III subunit alpha, partial [bacterium]
EHLCNKALPGRYPDIMQDIKDRLAHELDIIKNMGFSGYFLIVWDFIKYAKKNSIPVGPGRGSGAGSIVSYLLGITDVDPLKYGLIFERFLNPGRQTMPDLDIDFSDDGREKVIEYVRDKYGDRNVAQIVTFGSMQARLAVRDVGRVLNIPLKDVDKLAKLIPFGMTTYEALSINTELKKLIKENNSFKELFDLARKIEGMKRHIGVHAAGIVIAKDNMTNYVPFTKSNKDVVTTQYEGNSLVQLGLLKMDFLGLRNLTVIDNTIKLIKKFYNIDVDIDNIPLDDPKTYALLKDAQAKGVFQMESSGMRDLLRKIKPTGLEDIIALIALYRPGPMGSGMLNDFVARKHGRSKIKYDHKNLEPILKDTYGVLLYQEQVMQIAVKLAGFTPAQADNLRKAMGKKIPEIIEKEREHFLSGAKKNHILEKTATKIFDNIVKFGGYGFNKSHSTAYGIVSYRTAYLKTNYPVLYMTALLNSELGNTDKIATYVDECKQMGIEILQPDIQKSYEEFVVEGDLTEKKVRFGFLAVKNVGTGVSSIIEARADGEFKNLIDFLRRIDLRTVNKKVVESLIKAGAFDCLDYKRSALIEGLDKIMGMVSRSIKDDTPLQCSLFAGMEDAIQTKEDLPDIDEWHEHQILSCEKEVLGFYMSGHPLAHLAKDLKAIVPNSIADIKKLNQGEDLMIGGIITKLRKIKTKKGDYMAVIIVEDTEDEIEVVMFPRMFRDINEEVITVDNIVVVKGKIDTTRDEVKLLAGTVIPFKDAKKSFIRKLVVNLKTAGLEQDMLTELKNIFIENPGNCEVLFKMITPIHGDVLIKSQEYITVEQDMEQKIKNLFGEEAITYIT